MPGIHDYPLISVTLRNKLNTISLLIYNYTLKFKHMTFKQFKQEFRITDYKYDPWGCAMEAFFECAGRMNRRGINIPHEWNYRPGMGSDGTDKQNYWYSLFGRCGNKQLAAIGSFLYRYTNLLERCGKSY